MRVVVTAVVLLLHGVVWARELPDAPSAANIEVAGSQVPSEFEDTETDSPRVVDQSFILLSAVAVAATIADSESTAHCLSEIRTCREANPLFGPHPSRARLYGTSMSVLGLQIMASYWLRRTRPNGKFWIAPFVMSIGGHGIAAALNISHF